MLVVLVQVLNLQVHMVLVQDLVEDILA